MRRRRPGVTAAPTTAALATGDGPGRTAAVTTAALATGAPTTPTRPTRPGRRGTSDSLGLELGVGFDGGDDGLDRDAAIGDQLATRMAGGGRERRRPGVLVDQDAGDAARVHRGGEVLDVLFGEQLGQLRLEDLQWTELVEVGELHRLDVSVVVLDEHEDVDDPDRSGVDELDQLLGHGAGEVRALGRELDDQIVDGAELVEGRVGFGHRCNSFGSRCRRAHYCRAMATRNRSSGSR